MTYSIPLTIILSLFVTLFIFFNFQQSQFVSGKLEKQKARYPSKSVKKETLQKFYRSKSLPLVATIDYASKKRYSVLTVPIVTVYADVDLIKNPKGYQYLANRISKIAKEYLNKAVFVVSDKSENSHELNHYGLPDLKGGETYRIASLILLESVYLMLLQWCNVQSDHDIDHNEYRDCDHNAHAYDHDDEDYPHAPWW